MAVIGELVDSTRAGVAGALASARAETRGGAGRWFAAGIALTVAGVLGILISSLTSAVMLKIGCILLTALGLRMINPRLRKWADQKPKLFLSLGGAECAAGITLLVLAFSWESVWAAGVAVFILIAGWLTLSAKPRLTDWHAPTCLIPVGPLLVLVGPLLAWALNLPLLLGLVVSAIGIAGYTSGLRRVTKQQDSEARRAAWAGMAAAVMGAAVLVWGSATSSVTKAGAGAFLVVLGVIAMTAGWRRLELKPVPPMAVAVIGLATILVGGFLLYLRLHAPLSVAIAFVGVLWLIGGSFVVRGEVLIFVVAMGLVSVWLLIDRSIDPPQESQPRKTSRILALGDSYMSGEGSPAFFEGTNEKGTNQCRRSPTAYPYVVARKMNMGLDFYACSGAKAGELYKDKQQKDSPSHVVGGLPQLQNVKAATKDDIKVVLVSVGGNDALFGDIGQGCVLPGSCDERREVWLANLDQIGTKLTAAYDAIRAEFLNVPIVAIPYPLLLNKDGCGSSLMRPAEHAFLSEFLTVLNDRVRVSAANAGVNFFEGGMFAFRGSEICAPHATAMNIFNLNPVGGGLVDRISPRNWIHGSLHPTPAGHQLMANALVRYLEEDLLARTKANPEPEKATVFRLRNVGSASPTLYDPAELQTPPGIGCPVKNQPALAFATRVVIFDEESPFALDARPDSPVCYTASDGSWKMNVAGPAGDVTSENGVVRVRPQPRAEGQRVVYQDTEGTWRLRLVDFCSKTDDCPSDTGAWVNRQLADAAKEMAVPIVLVLLGGWLSTIGLAVWSKSWWSEPKPEADTGPASPAAVRSGDQG